MWKELERRGVVYARILFSVREGQAHVDAVILYDGYAPPWHHELGEVEPDSDLGVALWVAGGGRDIEQGDVVLGDGEMGFRVAERAVNTAWNDHPPPVRRRDVGPDGQVFTVLVGLPGGEGVVRRVDREVMVTGGRHADGRQPVRADNPATQSRTSLPDNRSLVGGILPPFGLGQVVDDRGEQGCGRGRAAVRSHAVLNSPTMVTSQSSAAVRNRSCGPAATPGRLSEHPGGRCRRSVPGVSSHRLRGTRSTEQWRGGTPGPDGTVIPNPIVICQRCGHEEREGTFFGGGAASDDDEDDAAREARVTRVREHTAVRRWLSTTMTLRALTFPVYAAEGWPAVIGGSGSHGDRLTSLTIAHHDTPDADPYAGDRPRFEITTSREDSLVNGELHQARWTLDGWLHNNDEDARSSWPEASPAAVSLWLAARDAPCAARCWPPCALSSRSASTGTPAPFLTLTTPSGSWVAVRHHGDLVITVAARRS